MTVLDVDTCGCGQPATRTLAATPYCDPCAEQILGPIRAKHPSNGQQTGPLRPDYGPGWAELTCTTCGGEWIGRIGETCGWCVTRLDEPRKAKLALLPINGDYEPPDATQGPDTPNPDDELRGMLISWPQFWAHDHADGEWLAEPVLPAGRSVALFAPGGTGKSLFALWLAANLATGRDPFSGRAQPPIDVLYLDYEMTEADLSERLEQMGFGADNNLAHLHYALLPSLPGLDQPDGGRAVIRLAELVNAQLVIIDTFGRAVHGDENDADTVRAWYRWTGLHLKAAGRAFARVDHAGKDKTKGQRGTSGKNDDVDIVWELTAKDAGAFTLSSKWKRRMSWVPLTVDIVQTEEPLTYRLAAGESWPAGTKECATALDQLCLPDNVSSRTAARALSESGNSTRRQVVLAAIKYRKQRADNLVITTVASGSQKTGNHPNPKTSEPSPEPPPPNPTMTRDGTTTGTTGNHPLPQMGTTGSPPRGNQFPAEPKTRQPTDLDEVF